MFQRYVLNKIEDFIAKNSRAVIKPLTDTHPPDKNYLALTLNRTRSIDEVTVKTEQGDLIAHKMQLQINKEKAAHAPKMAMIYMPGNSPYINDSLPTIEPLMQRIQSCMETSGDLVNLVAFCQHYRGRGSNHSTKKMDNFNDYPMAQDAKDQAALIKTIVDLGYAPENILVMGYSYGSAIAIWSVYELIQQFDTSYAKIKIYSDRGFGNLFNFRFVKPFIGDQKAAHQKLHEEGMMPALQLHEIVHEHLPNCMITNIKNDNNIWLDFDLANSFNNKQEFSGRIFETKALRETNPHFEDRAHMSLKGINEVKPHHLLFAMLTQTPICITYASSMIKSLQKHANGYALTKEASADSSQFIAFPSINTNFGKTEVNGLEVECRVLENLMLKLDQYCDDRAERAAKSGSGGEYNHAWLGRTGFFGWTAKQQLVMATRIMQYLCASAGPAIQQLEALKNEAGPHHSGDLGKIVTEINDFIETLQWLQHFNAWVMKMGNQHEAKIQNTSLKQ